MFSCSLCRMFTRLLVTWIGSRMRSYFIVWNLSCSVVCCPVGVAYFSIAQLPVDWAPNINITLADRKTQIND